MLNDFPSLNHIQDDRYHGNDQQNVDDPACIEGEQADGPSYYKDYGNDIE